MCIVLICFYIAHVSQGWGSKIIFWKFHKNVWFSMWLFWTSFGMFCDSWLNFETLCIICHQFPTQPIESFCTSPNIFACYAWQHILILDERKSKWNQFKSAGGPLTYFFPGSATGFFSWICRWIRPWILFLDLPLDCPGDACTEELIWTCCLRGMQRLCSCVWTCLTHPDVCRVFRGART